MRINNASVEQFVQEVDKHEVTDVICTRSFNDSVHLNNVVCLKEDGCIRLASKARVLHISRRTVCGMENNNKLPYYDRIIVLCMYFKVLVDQLLGLKDD